MSECSVAKEGEEEEKKSHPASYSSPVCVTLQHLAALTGHNCGKQPKL